MADIILAGDSFSLKKLRSAAEQLEDAQNLMQKVYDAVYSTGFWAEANPFALFDGGKNMNVFDGTIDELNAFQQRVRQKEETLRALAQRIEAAVQEIAETDQSFRGKLSGESGKSTWERITGAVKSVGQTVSAAAVSLIGAINGLFSSDGTVAGETVIETPVQKKIRFTDDEIETIYGEFDWRGISVTDEEKTAIVQRASDKWELHLLFEKLYNEKLDAMTDYEKYRRQVDIINAEYTGEVQHYQRYGVTSEKYIDAASVGQCTWVAGTTLIRRKRIAEGKDSDITCEDLLNHGGGFLQNQPYKYNGDQYSFNSEEGPFTEDHLRQLLDKHPEGIEIYWDPQGNGYGHAIVLTDYAVSDNGIVFYADDGVNNGSSNYAHGRVTVDQTSLYWYNHGSIDNLRRVYYLT